MKLNPIRNPADLITYNDAVVGFSQSTTKVTCQSIGMKVQGALDELGIKESRLLITGSDGRGENPIFLRRQSPADLILTIDEFPKAMNAQDLKDFLSCRGVSIDEIKGPIDERLFFDGDSHSVFPTRVFDAVLVDSFEPSPTERNILFSELRKHAKNTIKRFTKKVGDAEDAMISGTSRIHGVDRREINFDEKVIHYDPKNKLNGVKTGPLRLVQYGLMRFIIQRIRGGESGEIDLVLPSNIIQRIDMLASSGVLPLTVPETEDLKYAYGYLLYLHHMMQLEHIESGRKTFDVEDSYMREIKQMFDNLKIIIAKLGNN